MKKQGFTLAEVLITLGIIGVVAALTIPSLIANSQKQQYLTGLKKAYTTMNQALAVLANENGCPGDLACTGLFKDAGGYPASAKLFGDELVKYVKTIKIDPVGTNNNIFPCFKYNFDGTGTNTCYNMYHFMTPDGMSFQVSSNINGCTTDNSNGRPDEPPKNTCGTLYVDVNGPKKGPNFGGRDIFFFYITSGKSPMLYPFGGAATRYHWSAYSPKACTSEQTQGDSCAARIMEEGWEMNY